MWRLVAFVPPPWASTPGARQAETPGGVGRVALAPKIFAGLNDGAAEDFLPEAVDGDAGRQRVVLIHEPVSESQAVRHLVLGQGIERGRDPRVYFVALAHEAAAQADVSVGALEKIGRAHV